MLIRTVKVVFTQRSCQDKPIVTSIIYIHNTGYEDSWHFEKSLFQVKTLISKILYCNSLYNCNTYGVIRLYTWFCSCRHSPKHSLTSGKCRAYSGCNKVILYASFSCCPKSSKNTHLRVLNVVFIVDVTR